MNYIVKIDWNEFLNVVDEDTYHGKGYFIISTCFEEEPINF